MRLLSSLEQLPPPCATKERSNTGFSVNEAATAFLCSRKASTSPNLLLLRMSGVVRCLSHAVMAWGTFTYFPKVGSDLLSNIQKISLYSLSSQTLFIITNRLQANNNTEDKHFAPSSLWFWFKSGFFLFEVSETMRF